jgi:hypothetical protein
MLRRRGEWTVGSCGGMERKGRKPCERMVVQVRVF